MKNLAGLCNVMQLVLPLYEVTFFQPSSAKERSLKTPWCRTFQRKWLFRTSCSHVWISVMWEDLQYKLPHVYLYEGLIIIVHGQFFVNSLSDVPVWICPEMYVQHKLIIFEQSYGQEMYFIFGSYFCMNSAYTYSCGIHIYYNINT